MTDSPDGTDPELTPAQEAEVRRLLADARHAEPAPADVVARLDRVLADLASEPAREATVTRLADRRRRAGLMLVAAAAVVVAGVGIGKIAGGGAMGGADSETAASAPEAATADEEAREEDRQLFPESAGGSTAYSQRQKPFRITARGFSDDARSLRGLADAVTMSEGSSQYDEQTDDLSRAESQDVCEAGEWGSGRYVSVLYDDAPGWVVIRPAQGSTQVADLFLCGSEVATRSVTLPVR